jgi:hypothetical protein
MKEKPIERVIEEREKERLGMTKSRISTDANPNSIAIDATIVSFPSKQAKHKISIESNLVHTCNTPIH